MYVPAVRQRFLCDMRRGFEPIRVTKIGITRQAHVLQVFHVLPKREFAHFYLVLFNKNDNFENEIYTGIYEWE